MLVADEFGIPVDRVRVDEVRDTSKTAYTWQTVGSRGCSPMVLPVLKRAKMQRTRFSTLLLR